MMRLNDSGVKVYWALGHLAARPTLTFCLAKILKPDDFNKEKVQLTAFPEYCASRNCVACFTCHPAAAPIHPGSGRCPGPSWRLQPEPGREGAASCRGHGAILSAETGGSYIICALWTFISTDKPCPGPVCIIFKIYTVNELCCNKVYFSKVLNYLTSNC